MAVKDFLNQKRVDFDKVLGFYKNDIATIRTGRANPAMVEDIEVDYYNQKFRIKELASINIPEPRTVVIQPWDKGSMEAISGAIRKSDLGLNPVVDSNVIRLNIPSLTEERRKEFVKLLKQKSEESRIKIRRVREETWDKIQKMEKDKEIREDEKFKAKEDLQKMTDEFNKKIEELEKKKEGELMM
jgi:ribosome recycling factor